MLSNPQKALLKRAQRQARLDDAEYRDTLELCCGGARSSTDPRISNEQWDQTVAFIEAIYWRGVEEGRFHPPGNRFDPFQKPGYWAAKNTRSENSRDRYTEKQLASEIHELELQLLDEGLSRAYCEAIKRRTGNFFLHYRAALQRTLAARKRQDQARRRE